MAEGVVLRLKAQKRGWVMATGFLAEMTGARFT
jgi:hypothetical protein